MTTIRHDLIEPAREYYDSRLPYHNWNHAQEVMRNAYELGRRAEKQIIAVDMGVVAVAAAWHDAGYIEDHRSQGFMTKEDYSIYLVEQFLSERSEPIDFINAVAEAIRGTIHSANREDLTALLLHRADIKNIGGPYAQFYRNSSLLYSEDRLFGHESSWRQWTHTIEQMIEVLVLEAEEELPRLGEPIVGEFAFPQQARRNSQLLLKTIGPMRLNS